MSQDRAKRRRLDKSPDPLPDTAGDDTIAKFAHEYFKKVQTGLRRLGPLGSGQGQVALLNLGAQLLEHRLCEEQDRNKLETLLKDYQTQSSTDKWLANIYGHYAAVQRRYLDPEHSETGDNHKERLEIRKESMCEVTSAVVNRLEPYWGVCASLIFNALRGMMMNPSQGYMLTDTETKFKGSALYSSSGIRKGGLNEAVEAIVNRFLGASIEFTIKEDTPVVNPAFFLTLVRREDK